MFRDKTVFLLAASLVLAAYTTVSNGARQARKNFSDKSHIRRFLTSFSRTISVKQESITSNDKEKVKGPPQSLFGRVLKFNAGNLKPGTHPRILFNKHKWNSIVNMYAKGRKTKGTWAKSFLDFTQHKGPGNAVLQKWANLDTSAYIGEPNMNTTALQTLANEVHIMSEYNEGGFFMCALHATVDEAYANMNDEHYLPETQRMGMAIKVIVNYAKILLAHYSTYGCSTCTYKKGLKYSDLWNAKLGWGIQNDWYTGGLGIALSYDVLYHRMSGIERLFVRSAMALMVKGRQHWGITDHSNKFSPNALLHPHRIFSNWATYHANLFLTNLAIEREDKFDNMTTKVGVGFNKDIHEKSIALYDAFFKHSIYPEGSTFEDGYTYNLAFREGSLAFIALAKRGHNHIDTNRFRNFIYNSAQMHEPFRCGKFVGHSSGGGDLYPTSYALFRYAYPKGELPNMLWSQRMGQQFISWPCRIWWHQIMMQMSILGGEHLVKAESPAGLSKQAAKHFALSMYQPRRGIVVARTNLFTDSIYMHFDARPDAFLLGHDNADRGVITLSALGRTWLDELSWRSYPTSQVHSIMHIDGQAQALKATSVRLFRMNDDGDTVVAAADLTYAYNVQWARAFSYDWKPNHWEYVFVNGKPLLRNVVYTEKETGSPLDFGWPADDDASDLGITKSTKIWGEPDIGFSGIHIWKRKYREVSLKHAVRSTVLVRSQGGSSYALIGDNFAMTGTSLHTFQSYLILAPGVHLKNTSHCTGNHCYISLEGGPMKQLDVHVSTLGNNVTFKFELIGTSTSSRLVISSVERNFEKYCMVLHPHRGYENLKLMREGSVCSVEVKEETRYFSFNDDDHSLELDTEPMPTDSLLEPSTDDFHLQTAAVDSKSQTTADDPLLQPELDPLFSGILKVGQ